VIRQRKKRISHPYDLASLCPCALMSKLLCPVLFFLHPDVVDRKKGHPKLKCNKTPIKV